MKKYRPTTDSRRQMTGVDFRKILTSRKPEKSLTSGFKRAWGRNNTGRITTRHKGGGHKKRYRKINFNRSFESTAIVTSIEYDPNRTANIASIYNFKNNSYDYIISPLYLNNLSKESLSPKPPAKQTASALSKNPSSTSCFVNNLKS